MVKPIHVLSYNRLQSTSDLPQRVHGLIKQAGLKGVWSTISPTRPTDHVFCSPHLYVAMESAFHAWLPILRTVSVGEFFGTIPSPQPQSLRILLEASIYPKRRLSIVNMLPRLLKVLSDDILLVNMRHLGLQTPNSLSRFLRGVSAGWCQSRKATSSPLTA